jgi:hypothetical protein
MTEDIVVALSRLSKSLSHVVEQMNAAREGKMQWLDIVMPNGKKMRDCTGDEIEEVGKAFTRIAKVIEQTRKGADKRDPGGEQ